jgi:hypothetical protein
LNYSSEQCKEKEDRGRETLQEFVHINRPFSDKLRPLWQIDLVIKSLILERLQFFTLILHDLAIYSQFVAEAGVEKIFGLGEIYEFLALLKIVSVQY